MRRVFVLVLALAGFGVGCPALTEPDEPIVFAEPPPPPAPSPTSTMAVASVAPAPVPTPAPTAPPTAAPQEMAEASHILIAWKGAMRSSATRSKEEARKLIDKIIADLKKGADFAKLAKQYSDDASNKDKGGSLGTFGHGSMVPAFDAATFALKPGQTSGVVETQFGFHVIRRTK